MARVVLGIGLSHGPMMHIPPQEWHRRVDADRGNRELCYKGKLYGFEELVELRKPGFGSHLELDHQLQQVERCHRALRRLANVFEESRIDLVVIVGNDQRELFLEDNNPAILIYHGMGIDNMPGTEEQKKKAPPGIALAEPGHAPPTKLTYPGAPEFGWYLASFLMDDGFDVATSTRLPPGAEWRSGIPHAYGFPYRQIMHDRPPPSVPIVLNAFFAPNQPRVTRCLALGHALSRAIRQWPGTERVAVIGSGGLSHFVVDEEFDREILEAFSTGDEARVRKFSDDWFQSGSGEIRNWLPLAATMNDVGLKMNLIDYVPIYRSQAGTGTGMAFAAWRS